MAEGPRHRDLRMAAQKGFAIGAAGQGPVNADQHLARLQARQCHRAQLHPTRFHQVRALLGGLARNSLGDHQDSSLSWAIILQVPSLAGGRGLSPAPAFPPL
jgi:hypothetical protein